MNSCALVMRSPANICLNTIHLSVRQSLNPVISGNNTKPRRNILPSLSPPARVTKITIPLRIPQFCTSKKPSSPPAILSKNNLPNLPNRKRNWDCSNTHALSAPAKGGKNAWKKTVSQSGQMEALLPCLLLHHLMDKVELRP